MGRCSPFLRLLLALGLLAAGIADPASAKGASAETLVERLRAGGHVVFLRHAATDESEIDTGRLGDRAGQRNLSEQGRRQAADLGRAFRTLGIPVARVLASPVFRARDTAEIMFGANEVEVTMDLVADDYAGAHLQAMLDATQRLLAQVPEEGGNLILVGHRTPLEMVTGERFPDTVLPEGALAVFEPQGGGRTRHLGTISADALIESAGPG